MSDTRKIIEQALYEAEVDGLLRSAGRIEIAERIADALKRPTPCACGYPERHTNLPCSDMGEGTTDA